MESRFFRLVAISNQSTDDVDLAVDRAAVTGVLNLRDVLELVNHGFDDRTLTSKGVIQQSH